MHGLMNEMRYSYMSTYNLWVIYWKTIFVCALQYQKWPLGILNHVIPPQILVESKNFQVFSDV